MVIGALWTIILITSMIDAIGEEKELGKMALGLSVMVIPGVLAFYYGRKLKNGARFGRDRGIEEYDSNKGFWTAKCGWFILGGVALGGVAIAGWVSMPPAGLLATMLSFKLFHEAYKTYKDPY